MRKRVQGAARPAERAIIIVEDDRARLTALIHRAIDHGQDTSSLAALAGELRRARVVPRARVPRDVVLGWNLLGLALLANIVVVAVLATPAFRRFPGPPNLAPSAFPWVWLPSFLVQVAVGSHLLVFRQLRRQSRTASTRERANSRLAWRGPSRRSRPKGRTTSPGADLSQLRIPTRICRVRAGPMSWPRLWRSSCSIFWSFWKQTFLPLPTRLRGKGRPPAQRRRRAGCLIRCRTLRLQLRVSRRR